MSKESDSDDEIILNDARRSSRRSVATTSNSKVQQQSVLERLKQARATGKAFRARVDDLVQDVYMEVDDEEYQAKKQYYREFVEDDDGTGYYDDDSEDDLNDEERESKKKRKEEKRVKAKTGTIKHHFQAITSKQNPKDERSVCVDDDDILKECLADIVGTSDFGSGVEESEPCGSTASDMFSYSFGDFPALSMPNDNFLPASTLSTKENFMAPPTSSSENASISLQTFKTPEARRKPPTPSRTATTPSSSSRPPQSSPVSTAVNPFCVDKSKNLATPMQSCQREPQIREFSPEPVPIIEMDDMQSPPQTPTNSQRKRDASPIPSPMARPTKMARTEVDAKDGLKFFFLDAFEDAYKHPGTIYLFGRVKTLGDSSQTESCCLVLKNVSRQLFFIKRDKSLSTSKAVTAEDLNKEVQNTLKTKCGIARFRCKADLAMKKFISADETVPSECEALEVWANGSLARLPSDLSGDCFSHVMNTTTTPLERLLVEREIYGPCWLLVRNAEQVQCPVSHCPLEYTLNMEQMDGITMIPTSSNDPPPQITLISLNILTALNPETKENQIVMASLIHHTCNLDKPTQFEPKMLVNKRFCIVSKFKKGLNLPFDLEDQLKKNGIQSMVRKVGDEVALLNFLLTRLEDLNPDMILGHDLNAHLTLLHSRMEKYKLKKWDRMGRLKRSAQIQRIGNSKFALWEFTAGRLCLDSKTAASELIHSKSYEMEDLVAKLLKLGRQNLSTEQISAPFLTTNPQLKLIDLIKWNWNENLYTLKIVEQLNAIPLFVQITQIVGGVLSRTLMGGRAERNEFLLLHACFKNNYIPPDKHIFAKPVKNQKSGNMKKAPKKSHTMDVDGETVVIDGDEPTEEANPSAENEQPKKGAFGKKTQYTGGLVLEPKRGLYETYIVLLDFNSLYPSIIQEFNICFTTVDNAFADLSEADLPMPPGSSRPDGILKNEIRKLVSRRKEVKNLMKHEKPDSDKYQQYNIRQMGLKLTANSMYGCLGFQNSRFYAKTLAAMITSKGRELLMHTKTLVENENFSVIYGDTDSIMVNTNTTNFQQAKQIGQKLKQIVNKNYSLLELDIDGIYRRLLLLKKKKYAALSIDMNNENSVTAELKGLDIVRRDWSEMAKDIGEEIVNLILTPSLDRDSLIERIKATLAERKLDLEEGRFPLEKFEILRQLTKDPADYKDTKAQPHATIAMRLNETKKFRFRQGDIVKYIICNDGTNNPATQRGYHASEILANKELSVDKNYYLAQQIHPIVTRLCEPIEEVDACQVAEIIGLDPSGYRRRIVQNGATYGGSAVNGGSEEFTIGTHQDFSDCEGLAYECTACKKLNVVRSTAIKWENEFRFGLANCMECGKDVRAIIKKQLRLALTEHIKRNCHVIYVCDDITCGAECSVIGQFQFTADGIQCTKCRNGTLRKNCPDKKLYDQQCFFKQIADYDAFHKREKVSASDSVKKHYKECHSIVASYMEQNAFSRVDLSVVFAPLIIAKK